MAKRFTDTDKWKKEWFRTLPSRIKLLWNYILDNCDQAGIWSEDYGLASFQIGEPVSREDAQSHFGDRLLRLEDHKVFVSAFVSFQYGELKAESRPHASVIKLLLSQGIDPQSLTFKGYPKGIHTLKDKEQDKDKDQDQAKDQDQYRKRHSISDQDMRECFRELKRTLDHFKIAKDPKWDETAVARLLIVHGLEKTLAAIRGARFEERVKDFDPAKHFTVRRLADNQKIFEKCVNLGCASQSDKSFEAEQAEREEAQIKAAYEAQLKAMEQGA